MFDSLKSFYLQSITVCTYLVDIPIQLKYHKLLMRILAETMDDVLRDEIFSLLIDEELKDLPLKPQLSMVSPTLNLKSSNSYFFKSNNNVIQARLEM